MEGLELLSPRSHVCTAPTSSVPTSPPELWGPCLSPSLSCGVHGLPLGAGCSPGLDQCTKVWALCWGTPEGGQTALDVLWQAHYCPLRFISIDRAPGPHSLG